MMNNNLKDKILNLTTHVSVLETLVEIINTDENFSDYMKIFNQRIKELGIDDFLTTNVDYVMEIMQSELIQEFEEAFLVAILFLELKTVAKSSYSKSFTNIVWPKLEAKFMSSLDASKNLKSEHNRLSKRIS